MFIQGDVHILLLYIHIYECVYIYNISFDLYIDNLNSILRTHPLQTTWMAFQEKVLNGVYPV